MSETADFPAGSAETEMKIHGQILEDMNLEGICQLEELAARNRAYEAICAHLYRERMPLSDRLVNPADR